MALCFERQSCPRVDLVAGRRGGAVLEAVLASSEKIPGEVHPIFPPHCPVVDFKCNFALAARGYGMGEANKSSNEVKSSRPPALIASLKTSVPVCVVLLALRWAFARFAQNLYVSCVSRLHEGRLRSQVLSFAWVAATLCQQSAARSTCSLPRVCPFPEQKCRDWRAGGK